MLRIQCFWKRGIESNLIQYKELVERVNTGAILVDVRSPQEFREGHLEKAILIPEYEIKRKISNKIANKNQEIILYCESGGRSKKAYETLKKMGYQNVYELEGGIEEISN